MTHGETLARNGKTSHGRTLLDRKKNNRLVVGQFAQRLHSYARLTHPAIIFDPDFNDSAALSSTRKRQKDGAREIFERDIRRDPSAHLCERLFRDAENILLRLNESPTRNYSASNGTPRCLQRDPFSHRPRESLILPGRLR